MATRFRVAGKSARVALVSALVLAGSLTAAPATAAPAAAIPPIPCPTAPTGPDLLDSGPMLMWSLSAYRVVTRNNYWSVVATRGSQGYDPDIQLFDGVSQCMLGKSNQEGMPPTDWVAFDNNSGRLPVGTYPTRVVGRFTNTSPVKYQVQFVQGQRTLATSTPTVSQPIGDAYGDWVVDIRDVYLSAGSTYTFTVTGGLSAMHLLSSTATPATWVKTPTTVGPSLVLPNPDLNVVQTGTLTHTATQSGWYGALFVRNGWWGAPVSVRVSTP